VLTTTETSPPDDVRPAGADAPRRRGRRLALAAAVALALGGAGWWATHPDRLQPVGGGSSVLPLEVGQVAVVGMFAQPRSGTVTLTGAAARVRENTADAGLRVLFPVGDAAGGS